MKPTELFGVFVRTIGLLLIGCSLWRMLGALATSPYVTIIPGGQEVYTWPLMLFLVQLLVLAVGAVCFFWADAIVSLAYGGGKPAVREEISPRDPNRSFSS